VELRKTRVSKAVIFGAGNIGRGFIGLLFARAGREVVFIESDPGLVRLLNKAGGYPVRTLTEQGGSDIWACGVSAIDASDADAAADAVASAAIAATAVGARALEKVAPVIADGLLRRACQGRGPLDILICENLPGAKEKLAAWLAAAAPDEGAKALIAENAGLVETSIGRMTPVQTEEMKDGNPLRISAEPYAVLPVDGAAFKGRIPEVEGILPCENFDYYVKRKLYLHNMGHSTCAYLGLEKGYEYIADAVRDEEIRGIVRGARGESARALSAAYGADPAELTEHADDLLRRFGNRALGDTCARVGADAERKLGPSERFFGAMELCRDADVACPNIEAGAAAARRFLESENKRMNTEGQE
jgi:mannitol-1-phosphate 5-dehydrogenase